MRFEEFEAFDVEVDGTSIHGVSGGGGPPVLLLHGFPETHLMWHRVGTRLAERFTVVATDLKGFGASGAPRSTSDHAPYSMRALALEQVTAMRRLGHDSFGVVGHDRGARCAYRMALDHPDHVRSVAVLDIVPTGHAFTHATKDFALGYWVWSFLAAPSPVPETLVTRAPEEFVNHMLDDWARDSSCFTPEIREQYVAQFREPDRVHAICEQYRAAGTLDISHDLEDLGRRWIAAPLLALWGAGGPVDSWYDPLAVWRQWAADVTGGPVDCGHFLPEEAAEEVTDRLVAFLAEAHARG